MLNGYSASGNFVDRFAVLHPERVVSVTAGGLNGMPILPLERADGHELPYHVGIANVEELTGDPANLDRLDTTNQFLYMGGEDDNDTIPFDDAWTDDDLRQTALEVYGEDMIEDRFPRSQEAYREAGVSAAFRVYDGVGHNPGPAMDDVIEFHRASMNGESVEAFGEDLTSGSTPTSTNDSNTTSRNTDCTGGNPGDHDHGRDEDVTVGDRVGSVVDWQYRVIGTVVNTVKQVVTSALPW
jgi:hypothetical protein